MASSADASVDSSADASVDFFVFRMSKQLVCLFRPFVTIVAFSIAAIIADAFAEVSVDSSADSFVHR